MECTANQTSEKALSLFNFPYFKGGGMVSFFSPFKTFCQRLHSGHNKKTWRRSPKGYNVQNVSVPSIRRSGSLSAASKILQAQLPSGCSERAAPLIIPWALNALRTILNPVALRVSTNWVGLWQLGHAATCRSEENTAPHMPVFLLQFKGATRCGLCWIFSLSWALDPVFPPPKTVGAFLFIVQLLVEQVRPTAVGERQPSNSPRLPCFSPPHPHWPWSPIFGCTFSLVRPSMNTNTGYPCSVLETRHHTHALGEEGEKKIEGHGPVILSVHTGWAPDVVGQAEGVPKSVRDVRKVSSRRNSTEVSWKEQGCAFEIWWVYSQIISTNTNHATF